MEDIKIFNQSDLVLKVNPVYDPNVLNLDEWARFLDVLCGDREYQKEAIKTAIIYLASGNYKNLEELVIENYSKNVEIRKKYPDLNSYLESLQIKNKLFANIDLATATGKSYVIYGIAQIMLGLGLVSRVLVLCPSVTIERGLYEKFVNLSGDARLRDTIPQSAVIKNPSIIDANSTIKDGDICIENIHAVYKNTGSSIEDSFKDGGEDTLVLNDESHHIFNDPQSISGRSKEGQNIKKWKEFIINPDYNFKYILGFTGTAYHNNEYFNDVIYRYSLRQAINDGIVKSINYVQKDGSSEDYEKFQKIYQNHQRNKDKYSKIKPITIFVTKDINAAKNLREKLVDFLVEEEGLPIDEIDRKVSIVTSHRDHAENVSRLPYVDDKDDPVEWIVSVSMLTEGWDVKNVFQIVPWEDRAFNSKLLIAQVLGRGLRVPLEYQSPQPSVIVFNHDAWSRNIKSLVEEVLEIETRINSSIMKSGDRSVYNFQVYNLNYSKKEKEIPHPEKDKTYDYSKMREEGIKLDSQAELVEKETSYEDMINNSLYSISYDIKYRTVTINEIVNNIYRRFMSIDWESKIFGLGDDEVYSKDKLPPKNLIREIIRKSMDNVGIKGDLLIEKNAQKIYQAFSTLLRKRGKTVINELESYEPYIRKTEDMQNSSTAVSNLRRGYTLFYTNDYENEIESEEQLKIIQDFLEDETFPISSRREINKHLFKTPLNVVVTNSKPERDFVRELCKYENSKNIIAWIKSRDTGFYSIEYSFREAGHSKQKNFNPDFFIKTEHNDMIYYLVVEIKEDKDDSAENKAKYKYGKEHFKLLNEVMEEQGINERYIFHFLSPNGYNAFFTYLKDGRLFESQDRFRCELENMLENKE